MGSHLTRIVSSGVSIFAPERATCPSRLANCTRREERRENKERKRGGHRDRGTRDRNAGTSSFISSHPLEDQDSGKMSECVGRRGECVKGQWSMVPTEGSSGFCLILWWV